MLRVYGPKLANHPTVGEVCPACKKPFQAGDYTTLVEVGPADISEAAKMKAGLPYNALAIEVHANDVDPT